jgi:hypothetical protein
MAFYWPAVLGVCDARSLAKLAMAGLREASVEAQARLANSVHGKTLLRWQGEIGSITKLLLCAELAPTPGAYIALRRPPAGPLWNALNDYIRDDPYHALLDTGVDAKVLFVVEGVVVYELLDLRAGVNRFNVERVPLAYFADLLETDDTQRNFNHELAEEIWIAGWDMMLYHANQFPIRFAHPLHAVLVLLAALSLGLVVAATKLHNGDLK